FGRLNLESLAHDVMSENILARGNPDACTRARPTLEQPFELEAQQRHRHREKAHPELGGQFSPGNDLAQTNRPADDPTPDDAVGFLSEARRFRGRFHGRMSITSSECTGCTLSTLC